MRLLSVTDQINTKILRMNCSKNLRNLGHWPTKNGRHSHLRIESLEHRSMLNGAAAIGDLGIQPDGMLSDFSQPNFSLEDVNPTSTTYQQQVSPRDYLGKVSGWYFGYAT